MIYEIRTYDLKVRSQPEVPKRFAGAIDKRQALSPLVGFFHTDIGMLNQIVHIWSYDDADHRERVREEAAATDWWPPKVGEFIIKQTNEIFTPWPGAPKLSPGTHGPFYEMRNYHIQKGRMDQTRARWDGALAERTSRSPLLSIMECELESSHKLVHFWPYKSLDERWAVRSKAVADGIWPPKGGDSEEVISQENKILIPASFSPLQ